MKKQRILAIGLIVSLISSSIAFADELPEIPKADTMTASTLLDDSQQKESPATPSNIEEADDSESSLIADDDELTGDILLDDDFLGSNMIPEEESATPSDAVEMFYYTQTVSGYQITLQADAGTIPEGTIVSISPIEKIEDTNIEQILTNFIDDNEDYKHLISFDITLLLDGKEIEPENGTVNITVQPLSDRDLSLDTEETDIKVFHVKATDRIDEIPSQLTDDGDISYMADSFSIYSVGIVKSTARTAPRVVYAKTSQEFIDALQSDTTIILEGKTYNTTRTVGTGPDAYDESDLELYQINNLTIQGTDGTRIVSNSGSDIIFDFVDCHNIFLQNLVIGHDIPQKPQYECDTDIGVIRLFNADLSLDGCDIFGCGWFGIRSNYSSITATNSKIRDCTSHILDITANDKVCTFTNCSFYGNGYAKPFIAALQYNGTPEQLIFENCSFSNNFNPNFCGTVYGNWELSETDGNDIFVMDGDPVFFMPTIRNCTFQNNTWGGDTIITITLDYHGIKSSKSILVKPGYDLSKLTEESFTSLSGYTFQGWYLDAGFTEPLRPVSYPLVGDITLYGKWEKKASSGGSGSSSGGSSSSSSSSSSGTITNGETYENGALVYYENGQKVTNAWRYFTYNGVPYSRYFDENGKMVTGWNEIDGTYYYFKETKTHSDYGALVSTADLTANIVSQPASQKLASYTEVVSFLDDVDIFTQLGYSLVSAKETIHQMWSSLFDREQIQDNGYIATVTNNFMNDPNICKAQLRKLVNKLTEIDDPSFMSGTEKTIADLMLSFAESTATTMGKDNGLNNDLITEIQNAFSGAGGTLKIIDRASGYSEAVIKQFTDYSKNIAILDSLRKTVPDSSQFAAVIDATKFEYKHAILNQMANNLHLHYGMELDDLVSIPQLLDKTCSTNFSTAFDIIDLTAGNLTGVNALQDVVYGNITVSGSLQALKKAEATVAQAAQSGNPNTLNQAITDYAHIFSVAKAAKLAEYQNILDYYEGIWIKTEKDHKKISELYQSIAQLENLSIYNQ